MSALFELLDGLGPASPNDKGSLFEIICLYFLKHDKFFKAMFSDVWAWSEFPLNDSAHDTGIDIAAKLRHSETYCAIQCKFRDNDNPITKSEIDSFLAASSKAIYSSRIIISNTLSFGHNALSALRGQIPPCQTLTLHDLERSIDWSAFSFSDLNHVKYLRKSLRPDQAQAVRSVLEGFKSCERGKLIMACGTGKTFTSLKIAEHYSGGTVLVLVPSISLLNQSLLAWNSDHDEDIPVISFAVCSDSTVGRKLYPDEDMKLSDLSCRPTTDADELVNSWRGIPEDERRASLTVIFSTYQSSEVIHDAQAKGFPEFDIMICDEAHRTAGVSSSSQSTSELASDPPSSQTIHELTASYFTKIHYDEFIKAHKRLYMTATPKIYSDGIKSKAKNSASVLCSMDDQKIYGQEFFRLSFSQAVNRGLLSDYKVMIFMIDADAGTSSEVSEWAKIQGCCKALSKDISPEDYDFISEDPQPMHKAVAFTSRIDYSKNFARDFPKVIPHDEEALSFEARHVDGTMSSSERSRLLHWLSSPDNDTCRILSNSRCLCEGVDVPALDAVIFLNPRKSEIDIVQSVGRVMRKSQGKNFGYVILPVVVIPGQTPEEALDKNESYQVVWKVLQALRSHDDHFNAIISSLDLNRKSPGILITRVSSDGTSGSIPEEVLRKWQEAITIKIVQKCGDREYWDKWVKDLAATSEHFSQSITQIISTDKSASQSFDTFHEGLMTSINPSVSREDAINMIAQHIVSRPVFNALFPSFSALNPIAQSMQTMIDSLKASGFNPDTDSLAKFYEHVRLSVEQAITDQAKQRLIRQIYERFFRFAFKKTADKLGIVYTPEPIVDFILHSAQWAVKSLLNIPQGLSAHNVHILDPFSGTGTFIVRLIQLGLISPDMLGFKYTNELHANEILLLAYYISAINIESAFHERNGGSYVQFPGMILADTFNMNKEPTLPLDTIFMENGIRAFKQEHSVINVIIGNPPYNVGQKSANDNNQRESYPALDAKIRDTYAKHSSATNKNSLYDSYIRAIRWATDRLEGRAGVICFVTNGSFIESNSADGLRRQLARDFTAIFVFNLRGNANTSGEIRRKEAGGVFGDGSRLPVCITLLVRDGGGGECDIRYYEVGDYLRREEKLEELVRRHDFGSMMRAGMMREIVPNASGDWVNQRLEEYGEFLNLGNKKEKDRAAVFGERYSRGVITDRDAWCYNFSREALTHNMASMIDMYNSERERWQAYDGDNEIKDFVNNDSTKISWSRAVLRCASKNVELNFSEESVRAALYRPYVKEYMYFDPTRCLNEEVYQTPSIFPTRDSKNLLICVTGMGSKKPFSVLMTDHLPSLDAIEKSQCFPLWWYESGAFGGSLERKPSISPEMLGVWRGHYGDDGITCEDVFYYVYGVLSSREYAERFGNDTRKVLARVPFARDFWSFSEAGRKLGELHVGYESVDEWPVELRGDASDLRVSRMRIVVENGERVIRYNEGLTIGGIPGEAWEYVVNGRSALEWIVERYQDSVDKASGLRNDCNAWCEEHGEADYIIKLIARVVRVSVETMKILRSLPDLGLPGGGGSPDGGGSPGGGGGGKGPCRIWYYEVGDYLRREEKLEELVRRHDFGSMMRAGMMREIVPNASGDWVNQRLEEYGEFLNLGNKKEKDRAAVFGERYSRGVITDRDAWCYNFSREALTHNMAAMIEVYNMERERWQSYEGDEKIEDVVDNDPQKISWSNTLYNHARNDRAIAFHDEAVRIGLYRPYVKEYMYFDSRANEGVYLMPSLFPTRDSKNLLICVTGMGSKKPFSVLMTDCIPELQLIMNGQCFPLWWYESGAFGRGLERKPSISEDMLRVWRGHYGDDGITCEDVFYYVYGVLSSREYAERFGNDTRKVLARVPFARDFWSFAEAGRKLGELHVGYESVDEWPVELRGDASDLRVSRMRIVVENGERVIRYNDGLTVGGIPSEAWEYVVNGRSALEWIVERYQDSVDKASGLRNDCNAWAGGEYVLGLIGRVARVSVETVRILGGMSELGV